MSLSLSALMAGISNMAFGAAKLFHLDDAGLLQIAVSLGAIMLGLACWAAGASLGRPDSRAQH